MPAGASQFSNMATAESMVLSFTASKGQREWLIGTADWERQGYRVASSICPGEGSFLISPTRQAYPVQRCSECSWVIKGHMDGVGRFVMASIPPVGSTPFSMILDSGAQVNVAGEKWETYLDLGEGLGTSIRGAGDHVIQVWDMGA